MLARETRLRSSQDINRVYSRGRSSGGSDLFAKSLRTELPNSRAVVVVGKKVSKKAVVRNQIRRRLAGELLRLWPSVAAGYDMVIVVTRDISSLESKALAQLLQSALARSGLIVNPKEKHV